MDGFLCVGLDKVFLAEPDGPRIGVDFGETLVNGRRWAEPEVGGKPSPYQLVLVGFLVRVGADAGARPMLPTGLFFGVLTVEVDRCSGLLPLKLFSPSLLVFPLGCAEFFFEEGGPDWVTLLAGSSGSVNGTLKQSLMKSSWFMWSSGQSSRIRPSLVTTGGREVDEVGPVFWRLEARGSGWVVA